MAQPSMEKKGKPRTGGLKITSETVLCVMREQVEQYGLDKAMQRFDELTLLFAGQKGWAETVRAVKEFFIEERKKPKVENVQPVVVNQNHNTTINATNAQYTEN